MAATTFRWMNTQVARRCADVPESQKSRPRAAATETHKAPTHFSTNTDRAKKIAFSTHSLPVSLKTRATSAPSPSLCARSEGILGKLTLRAEDSRPVQSRPELQLVNFRNRRPELFHAPLAPREASVHVLSPPGIPLRSKSGRRKRRNLCFSSEFSLIGELGKLSSDIGHPFRSSTDDSRYDRSRFCDIVLDDEWRCIQGFPDVHFSPA